MEKLGLALDHTGLAIADLETGRVAYERLGFTLTSRSMHAGSVTPGAPVTPWGSGNHCAMFEEGYLEVLGLVDPTLHSTAKSMVAQYQGLHIVALACENADDAQARAVARGVPAPLPASLERDAAFGVADEQVRRAKFRNVYLDRQAYPEARFIIIEHVTPDVLWQPHLLAHPNGALGLDAVYFVPADPTGAQARLTALAGAPVAYGSAERFALDRGALWTLSEEQLRALSGVAAGEVLHPVAGARFRVASLDALSGLLRARGIATVASHTLEDGAPSLWVGPADACGALLEFVQSTR